MTKVGKDGKTLVSKFCQSFPLHHIFARPFWTPGCGPSPCDQGYQSQKRFSNVLKLRDHNTPQPSTVIIVEHVATIKEFAVRYC